MARLPGIKYRSPSCAKWPWVYEAGASCAVSLYQRVQNYDWNAHNVPMVLTKPAPITVREITYRNGWITAAMVVGHLIGVAVIYDEGKLVAIGSRLSLAFLDERWPVISPKKTVAYLTHADRLDPPDIPRIKTHELRALRINLLGIQHRVCELYPGFRIRRPGGQQPGQAEVWLQPNDGQGRLLGGIIWEADYYYFDHYKKDHRRIAAK